MIATATYRDEQVMVIDMIWNVAKNRSEYLIAYGEPTWVSEDDLGSLVYLAA